MKNDSFENRMFLARKRFKISDERLSMSSTIEKYHVVLDDGKTVIYVSDKSKADETRIKNELQQNSRFPVYNESYIS